ncbi:hypothetical protein D9M68_871410 [compost metagenome]
MLKAINWPTLSLPSMTSRAPKYSVATVTSLEMSVTPPLAMVPMVAVRKLDDT